MFTELKATTITFRERNNWRLAINIAPLRGALFPRHAPQWGTAISIEQSWEVALIESTEHRLPNYE